MFKNVKIGISPLTWTNDDLPELGGHIAFEECIKEMAQAGYVGCEIGNKFPEDVQLLSTALAPHDLQIASQWFSTFFTTESDEPDEADKQKTIDGFIKQMQFLKAMGANLINVCEQGGSIQGADLPLFGNNKPCFSDKQWNNLIDGLHEIGDIAKQNDMQVAYHHHMGTGVQTADELDLLMSNTDPELVSLIFDSGHLVYADIDPLSIIENYGHRIKHVHLKDIRRDVLNKVAQQNMSFLDSVRASVFTVPGDGCIDFPALFNALAELDYQGWFIVEAEQDPNIAHPLTYAKKGREYIKSQIGV